MTNWRKDYIKLKKIKVKWRDCFLFCFLSFLNDIWPELASEQILRKVVPHDAEAPDDKPAAYCSPTPFLTWQHFSFTSCDRCHEGSALDNTQISKETAIEDQFTTEKRKKQELRGVSFLQYVEKHRGRCAPEDKLDV